MKIQITPSESYDISLPDSVDLEGLDKILARLNAIKNLDHIPVMDLPVKKIKSANEPKRTRRKYTLEDKQNFLHTYSTDEGKKNIIAQYGTKAAYQLVWHFKKDLAAAGITIN